MRSNFQIFFDRFFSLFRSVDFWVITVVGNVGAFVFASLFYHFEISINPNISTFRDCLWLAFSTITSVGYGDITLVSDEGRLFGIFLMIFGTGIFATYTAIFANVMLGGEFLKIGRRVKMLHRNVEGVQTNVHQEDLKLERELTKLNKTLSSINNRLEKLENIQNGEEK